MARDTMLLEMQSKHINYNLPQTKAVGLLCSSKSWHGQGCWVRVSVEKTNKKTTKKTPKNNKLSQVPLCFLTLFR